MSDKSGEVREWWIHSTGNAYTRDVSSQFPVVHVIEKSAYDALKAENERLNKQLALVSDSSLQISTQLAEQNNHLRKLLSEARDLFNRMSKFEIIDEELVKIMLTKLNETLGE